MEWKADDELKLGARGLTEIWGFLKPEVEFSTPKW